MICYTVFAKQSNSYFEKGVGVFVFSKNAGSCYVRIFFGVDCLATIGALRFSAHGFGCALFYFAQKWYCGEICTDRREENMPDYEKMYFELFNGITDTIEKLKELQQKAENLYIEQKEEK